MMRTSYKLALLIPLFALMAPTGGFPSRPTFQSVLVNSTVGTVALALNSNAATSFSRMDYRLGGTTQAITGVAGAANDIITGNAQNDFNVRTASGKINFSTNNGASGNVIIGGAAATTLTAQGLNGQNTVVVKGAASASNSFGVNIQAGSNSTDYNLFLQTFGGTTLAELFGDGGWVFGAPTGGDKGASTLNVAGGVFVNGTALPTFTGNAQQPVVGFDVTLQVGPTVVNCTHCQASPTIVRNSAGNYTVTFQSTGAYNISCTYRNNATQPGGISINSIGTGSVTLLAYTPAGALSDAQGPLECVGIS